MLFKKRMQNLLLLALLPGNQNLLSRVVIHHHPAGLLLVEAVYGHLAAIDQTQNQAVRQYGSEFFRQIQREARAAGPVPV